MRETWDGVWAGVFMPTFIAIFVVAGYDIHNGWAPLPTWVWPIGVVLFVLGGGLFLRAMAENPFFEKTVRIQSERGHHVIDTGPYRKVRHPGYVGLFAWILSIPLLKQKLRPADLGAGLICYSGVLVIATRGDLLSFRFSDPLGVGLALGSTVIWALYWIYNTRDQLDPVLRLFLNFFFSMPFVLAACVLFSDLSVADSRGYLGAAYVGFFEIGLAFVLWLSALRLTASTARVANLIFLSPFLSLLFIHYLVGEEILPSTLVGLALIMGGLLVQRLAPSRR